MYLLRGDDINFIYHLDPYRLVGNKIEITEDTELNRNGVNIGVSW
jgi:hypothetical protein